ncbi:transmembrane protein, putative (macronuclear) [Tetrahymena thermophila SB210]|uniref:Transmembrane protein, putative n=1 Tax=Tetrahymena thermophila (strain SB210) TaxID=312017 RepID=Q22SG3_TETTS|nr:transmembrane protein, putative [Tetrahymena thermophila SB210]EAR87809.2 transmembrane protein, putative [Tetrahymena thermophila SB210]|eukprot:XP_001008054.2 transmembrane protein, putative [Tetrahymena thermophila SB210]
MQNKTSKFSSQENNKKVSLSDKVLQFLQGKLISILHGFQRNRIFSIIYLTIYFIQVVSLSFNSAFLTDYASQNNSFNKDKLFENDQKGKQNLEGQINLKSADISVHYYIYKIVKYSRIYPLFYDIFSQYQSQIQLAIICIFISINTLLILHIIRKMILYLIEFSRLEYNKQSIDLNQKDLRKYEIDEDLVLQILHFFDTFDSFYMAIFGFYRYVFMIPNLLISISYLVQTDTNLAGQILAALNLGLAALVTLVVSFYDFDISFYKNNQSQIEKEDFLSRKISFSSILSIFGDITKCGVVSISLSVNQYLIVCIISVIFTCFEYAEFIISFIYLRNSIAKINFTYLNLLTIINLIIILFGFTDIKNDTSFILIIALFLPIVIVFSCFIFQFLEQRILNWSVETATRDVTNLDIYSRTVQFYSQNIDMKKYLYSYSGLTFESIATRHLDSCNDSSCFCRSTLDSPQQEKKVQRKKFLDQYLLSLFNSFLTKSKVSQYKLVRFQLLALLIDSIKCPLKSNIEAIQLSHIHFQNLSFREKVILNVLCQRANELFEKNVISIEKQKQQQIGGNFYQTETDLYDIIRFDQLLSQYQKQTRTIYQQRRDFFLQISCDEVNLIQVKQKGENLLMQLDQIDQIIEELNNINPLSRRCQELTLIYTSIFDMRKKRIRKQVIQQRKSVFHKIVNGDQKTLSFFSSKSCCLFVSMLKPVGIIKKCTRTIYNVFEFGQQEVINRSINSLMPDSISSVHDKILNNFITEGQTKNIMTSDYFFLAKSAKNFLLPIKATMRLANLKEEFGISCFLEKIETSNQFILIDDKLTLTGRRNKIINMSRDIYTQCFSTIFSTEKGDNKIGQIDLYKIIPFMQALDHQNCNELDYFQSIMIYPLNEHHFNNMKKRIKITSKNAQELAWYLIFALASNCGFLDISFSVKRLKSKYGHSFKYIEIQNIRKVKRRLEKLESLNTLRSDLNQIMKLNVSIDNKTLSKSLGLLGQSLKLSFTNNDFSLLFKDLSFSKANLSKQENEEEQKWQLKKKMTLQSLSNRDTTNAKSSAGIDFEDEIEDTEKVGEQSSKKNSHKQQFIKLKNLQQENENNNKSQFQFNNEDKTFMNTFDDTYHEIIDVSHIQLKKKSIQDLTSTSFQQIISKQKLISQNQLDNSFLPSRNDLNQSYLGSYIEAENNSIHINTPIQIQSSAQKSKNNFVDASFSNQPQHNRQIELQNEDSFQRNLKNFDSFHINHSSQNDSFGDQGKKFNNQVKKNIEEVIDTAKDRYEQATSRSQVGLGSVTGRELRGYQETDNDRLYYQQESQTKRGSFNALHKADYLESNTQRENNNKTLFQEQTDRMKNQNELNEEDNYDQKRKDEEWVNEIDSSQINFNKILKERKSAQFLVFASKKSSGNQSQEMNQQNQDFPIDRSRNDSFQMLQSLPQKQNTQNNRQSVQINKVTSQEAISQIEGTSRNNFNFDFEGSTSHNLDQDSSRLEKHIKQQVFYSGTSSSLTTLKKSLKNSNSQKQKKKKKKTVQQKKEKQPDKLDGNEQKNQKDINANQVNAFEIKQENDQNTNFQDNSVLDNNLVANHKENQEQLGDQNKQESDEYDESFEDDEEIEQDDFQEEEEKQIDDEQHREQNSHSEDINKKNENSIDKKKLSFESDNISENRNKDIELVERIDTGMDRSSSTRTRSDMSAKKQIVSTIMMQNFESVLVNTIKIIGYFSLLFIMFIIVFVYFTITSNLNIMQQNQNVIYLGPGMEEDASTMIIQTEFLIQYKSNLFLSKVPDSKLSDLQKGNGDELSSILGKIDYISITSLSFADVVLDQNDLKILSTYQSDGSIMYSVESTHFYAILQAYLGFIQYSNSVSKISRLYVIKNFLEIIDIFNDLRTSALNLAIDSADSTETVLVYTFIMIMVVAFITIGMIFPIYRKVQLSKEDTLKLLATFPKDKLESMIIQTEKVINSNIFIKNSTEKEVHLKSNIRWKKRTIANTTKLPKFNFFVSLGCLVAFILISLYPIINYIINHTYIHQLQTFITELGFIHNARGHSVFAKSLLYMRISAANENIIEIANSLDEFYPTLNNLNSQVIQNLQQILNNFQEADRFNYDLQKTYVYDSLIKDMCQQFQLFKVFEFQYERQNPSFLNLNDCRSQFQNILAHGMILELQKLFQIYKDLFYIAQNSNFTQKFQEWDAQYNFNQLDDLQEFQSGAFENIFLFQQSQMKNLFNYLNNIQTALLIYAIIIILLLFLIGWIKFVTYVQAEINQTKFIFSLFTIDSLLENNYIATFIKKSSKAK